MGWMRGVVGACALAVLAGDTAVMAARQAKPAVPISVAVEQHTVTESSAAASKRATAREAAIKAMFDRRAKAVTGRDRAAFLRDVDDTDRAFAARQAELFASLGKLDFASWSYEEERDASYSVGSINWRAYPGVDDVWLPVLHLTYQIKGFDRHPVERRVVYTIVRRGKTWSIANDRDLADTTSLGTDVRVDPWENGPIEVAKTAHSLVIGHPDDKSAIAGIQREMENAVKHVSSFTGAAWGQKVVVILPKDHDELEYVLENPDVPFEFAAVAHPEITEDGTEIAGARVVINPDNFTPGSSFNRRLIRHELTHVALFSRTGPLSPRWLVEGIAEYVGNSGATQPTATLASALADLVDAKGVPDYLPLDSDFGILDDAGVGYDSGWLLCRYVAQHYGRAALFTLYDEMGSRSGLSSPGTKLDGALKKVLHVDQAGLLKAWRPYVRAAVGDLTDLLVAPGKGYTLEDTGRISTETLAKEKGLKTGDLDRTRMERAAQGVWFTGDTDDPSRIVVSTYVVGADESSAASVATTLAKQYLPYHSGNAIPHGKLYLVSISIHDRRYNEAVAILRNGILVIEVRVAMDTFSDPSGEARRIAAALYAKAA